MKRTRIVIAIVVIIVAIVAISGARSRLAQATGQTQYKVAAASVGEVEKTVSATGTLQPWTTVDIKSKAGGRVDKLLVDQGTVVTKGQVIALIDPTDTMLSVNTAKAGLASSNARRTQNELTYQLQVQQTRIAIETAKAQLASAIASRNASKARLNQARLVKESQPMLTSSSIQSAKSNYENALQQRRQLDSTDRQDKASAQAAYDQAVANEKNAMLSLTRQQSLMAKGYVAQGAVDQAQAAETVAASQVASASERLNTIDAQQAANIAAADARVAQARAQWNSAQAGSTDVQSKQQALAESQANYDQAVAQVSQSRAALDQAIANQANNAIHHEDITQAQASVESAKASLVNADVTLDQTTVRAPAEGVVLQKYVEQGTIITSGLSLSSTGTSIVQLGDISRMYVNAQVDEADLAQVDVGQAVSVTFDAFPGINFDGKVSRIDPLAQVVQNVTLFNVRVEIDNSATSFRLLLPGMNATCDFIKAKVDDAINVPNEAVTTDDGTGTSTVQVATGGKVAPGDAKLGLPPDPNILVDVKIEKRTVTIGVAGNDVTEIKEGLKEGEKVVTSTIAPESANTPAASSPFGGGGFGGGRGGGGGGGRGGGR